MLIVFVYISGHFGPIHSLNVRRNLKRKKSLIKPLFLVSRLFKVADFGVDRKNLWDCL